MAVDFKAKQAEFAAYIRNPEHAAVPDDVDPQRMAMYRELFFNNINSFLSSNFPVLRTILTDEQWQELAQDFFVSHRCQTPHFSEIAEEFLDYLQNQRNSVDDYPFLLELAHYEWVEMAVSIAQATPNYGDPHFVNNILQQHLTLSPVAWPLVYQFPVERIGPEFLPQSAPDQPSYLIVYRDREDQVHFMQTTPYTYRLLQLIEENSDKSGEDYLQILAAELPDTLDRQSVLDFALNTLQDMASKGILIPAVAV